MNSAESGDEVQHICEKHGLSEPDGTESYEYLITVEGEVPVELVEDIEDAGYEIDGVFTVRNVTQLNLTYRGEA